MISIQDATRGRATALGRRIRENPRLLFGLIIIVVVSLLAILAPVLAPYDPEQARPGEQLIGPSLAHWLGTDRSGMDILSRLIYAPRVDLTIALAATVLAMTIGSSAGLLAGYYRNVLSGALMRIADLLQSFPVFILGMALVTLTGKQIGNVVIALAIVNAPVYARLVRSEVVHLRERLFVEAARAAGSSDISIIFRHLLPNTLGPVFAMSSVTMGASMLVTSGLSFVGAGVRVPIPEWGSMIAIGAPNLLEGGFWWPSVFPGLALSLTVLGFGMVGDALAEIIDPRKRGGIVPVLESAAATAETPEAELQLETDLAKMVAPALQLTAGGAPPHESEVTTAPQLPTVGAKAAVPVPPVAAKAPLTAYGLTTYYFTRHGVARALNGVDLVLERGETLGIVGETGSGKSTLVWSILGLVPFPGRIVKGDVYFEGSPMLRRDKEALRRFRGKEIGLVPQNARAHLNPLETVGDQLVTAYQAHADVARKDALTKALDLLDSVAIPDPRRRAKAYPHELSGGMAQRVMLAMAILHSPQVLVADEPTMGLDVTIQVQILDLLAEQVRRLRSTTLLVTRDLGIVANYCDRVGVMYAGQIVELAPVPDFFKCPRHPYSIMLLDALRYKRLTDEYQVVRAARYDAFNLPAGCLYNLQCRFADELCRRERPELLEVAPRHFVRCHHTDEVVKSRISLQ